MAELSGDATDAGGSLTTPVNLPDYDNTDSYKTGDVKPT